MGPRTYSPLREAKSHRRQLRKTPELFVRWEIYEKRTKITYKTSLSTEWDVPAPLKKKWTWTVAFVDRMYKTNRQDILGYAGEGAIYVSERGTDARARERKTRLSYIVALAVCPRLLVKKATYVFFNCIAYYRYIIIFTLFFVILRLYEGLFHITFPLLSVMYKLIKRKCWAKLYFTLKKSYATISALLLRNEFADNSSGAIANEVYITPCEKRKFVKNSLGDKLGKLKRITEKAN